jgi:hypothetical protein
MAKPSKSKTRTIAVPVDLKQIKKLKTTKVSSKPKKSLKEAMAGLPTLTKAEVRDLQVRMVEASEKPSSGGSPRISMKAKLGYATMLAARDEFAKGPDDIPSERETMSTKKMAEPLTIIYRNDYVGVEPTDQLIRSACKYISLCVPPKAAMASLGVTESVFRHWVRISLDSRHPEHERYKRVITAIEIANAQGLTGLIIDMRHRAEFLDILLKGRYSPIFGRNAEPIPMSFGQANSEDNLADNVHLSDEHTAYLLDVMAEITKKKEIAGMTIDAVASPSES